MYILSLLLAGLFMVIGLLSIAVRLQMLALLFMLCGLLCLLFAWRVGKKRRQEAFTRAGQALQEQIDAWRNGAPLQPVHVACKGKLLWFVLLATLLVPTAQAWLSAPSLGLGVFVFSLATIELIISYRLMVEAADGSLHLTETGAGGCGWGEIPWQAIDAVGLVDRNYSHRGMDNYVTVMVLLIRDIRPLLPQLHWLRRLYLRLRRSSGPLKASFNLRRTLPPSLLKALARELWTRQTGLTHDYWPDQSAAINQSLRESDRLLRELDAQHKAELAMLEEASRLADSDEKAAEAVLRKLKSQDPGTTRRLNTALLENASQRQRILFSQANWVLLGIVGILGAAALAAAIAR